MDISTSTQYNIEAQDLWILQETVKGLKNEPWFHKFCLLYRELFKKWLCSVRKLL